MIEPYITEKQCRICFACKPETDFSPTTGGKRHSYCKVCRARANARYQRNMRTAPKRGQQGDRSDTAWILPSMSFGQALACVRMRKWRGPVDAGQLRARL